MNEHIERSEGRRIEDVTVRDANAMLRAANIRLREANKAVIAALERFTRAKWTDAVKFGAGMMVANIELSKDTRLTMYAHKDAIAHLTGSKDDG